MSFAVKLVCITLLSVLFICFTPTQILAAVYHVSPSGSNGDALSWATAWRDFGDIVWGNLRAGDKIYIDGGPASSSCPSLGPGYNCGKVYNSTLNIGASGSSGLPITIQLAPDPEHSGTVILDGGVNSGYNNCAEYASEPTPPSVHRTNSDIRDVGLNLGIQQWVVVDGTKWGGIEIRNHRSSGLSFSSSKNSTVRYVKSHHNTNPDDASNSSVGATQGSSSDFNTLARSEIFRNGQDAVRGGGDHFTLEENYLHDHYCRHPDGIQAFVPTGNDGVVTTNEGLMDTITIRRNIFENIKLQPIFLGENNGVGVTPAPGLHDSWAINVEIAHNLIYGGGDAIKSKHGKSQNWNVHHNTVVNNHGYAMEWGGNGDPGAMAPMNVTDNIFYQTPNYNDPWWTDRTSSLRFKMNSGLTNYNNNCEWLMSAKSGDIASGGVTYSEDPQFTNIAGSNFQPNSVSCTMRGACITSVTKLLSDPSCSGISSPTPTPGPSPTPLPTPTPLPLGCFITNNTWQYQPFASQTLPFTYQFDATPGGTNIDGVMGFSTTPVSSFSALSAIVRFNSSGFIDAFNGTGYQASNPIPYLTNQTYRIRLTIDVPAQTYTAYVTPPNGQEITIGTNFGFRTPASSLSVFNTFNVSGSQIICNNTLSSLPGDYDQDGDLDFADFNLLIKSVYQQITSLNLVGTNVIDIFDYNALLRYF